MVPIDPAPIVAPRNCERANSARPAMKGRENRPDTSYANAKTLSTRGTGTEAGTRRKSTFVVVPRNRKGNGSSIPIDPDLAVTFAPYATAVASAMRTSRAVICPLARTSSAAYSRNAA